MADPLLSLSLPAPAKLNLFLHITGQRADDYHLLQTLFVFLDYSDTITLTVLPEAAIQRISTIVDVPAEQDLVVRAAKLLQQVTQTTKGVSIQVIKRLPMGGGLGGGSSDAATVLVGLNKLWDCGLSIDELAALGLRLGADVPVFVKGQSAWAEGIGEILQAVSVPQQWYVVVHPNVHISTAKLFAHPALTRNCQASTMATFLAGLTTNVFEPVVKEACPAVAEAHNWLSQFAKTSLTGSGACLFAAFESQHEAKQVLGQLPQQWSGFVAQSQMISPLYQVLNNQYS